VSGALIENDINQPHTMVSGAEVHAAMTRVTREVVARARVPIGVEVLLNDWRASLAIASATGASFIRMDFFVDRVKDAIRRTLEHGATGRVSIEGLTSAMGVDTVVCDPFADPAAFERLLVERLARPALSIIVARRPCVLAAADIRGWDKRNAERAAAQGPCGGCVEEVG
jgi:TPP-dependent indolepyruvate ferredoxin oxidoreductase alpha subunit